MFDELEEPLVSNLKDGESITIFEIVKDKPEEPPRNKITYNRIEDYIIRTHINYYGHIDKEEIAPEEADFECNGYLTFHGWEIDHKPY